MKRRSSSAASGFATERLLLLPLGPADRALFVKLYGDADVMARVGAPLSAAAAERLFEANLRAMEVHPQAALFLAVQRREDGQFLGLLGCPELGDRIEIGMLLARAAQSRGYAREAIAALVERLRVDFPEARLWVRFDRDHAAAERMIRSVGFREPVTTAADAEGRVVLEFDDSGAPTGDPARALAALERCGADASLRHASRRDRYRWTSTVGLDSNLQWAMLGSEPARLGDRLGAIPVSCCALALALAPTDAAIIGRQDCRNG